MDPKFKTVPKSDTLTKISREDIRRLRNEGTHDNAAQIANLCLADFETLDIAFSDLVREVDETEKADDAERKTATQNRIKTQAEIKKLNDAEQKKKK